MATSCLMIDVAEMSLAPKPKYEEERVVHFATRPLNILRGQWLVSTMKDRKRRDILISAHRYDRYCHVHYPLSQWRKDHGKVLQQWWREIGSLLPADPKVFNNYKPLVRALAHRPAGTTEFGANAWVAMASATY